jgi:microcystin-dependent protein
MQRINTANVAPNLFGFGRNGFSGGNPATNTPATFLSPEWCNAVQEELCGIVELLGYSLSGNNKQIAQILKDYFVAKSAFSSEIGKISYVPAQVPSPNHVPVFGVELLRGAYFDLYEYATTYGAIVTDSEFAARPGCFSYGSGGPAGSTFRVPNIPGLVIKSYHNGDGTYTTNTTALIGQYLPDVVKEHGHNFFASTESGAGTAPDVERLPGWNQGVYPTSLTGGPENTVRSVVLFPQIRYR